MYIGQYPNQWVEMVGREKRGRVLERERGGDGGGSKDRYIRSCRERKNLGFFLEERERRKRKKSCKGRDKIVLKKLFRKKNGRHQNLLSCI